MASSRLVFLSLLCSVLLSGGAAALPGVVASPTGPDGSVAPPDARIPISKVPFRISAPGSYVLTKNLVGKPGANGIEVQAGDVTIDLNGFALIGVAGSGAGIRGFASGPLTPNENLRILNGTVRGWGARGVDVGGFENAQLSAVRVTRNAGGGVRAGVCVSIDASTVRDNGGVGVEGTDCATLRSVGVEGNAGDGVVVGRGATLENVSACENARGILVGAGSTVTGSTASRNRGDGIRALDGATLHHVTASDNAGTGISIGSGGNLRSSVANKNGKRGILAQDFSQVVDSTAYENAEAGIDAVVGNVIVGNQVSANAVGVHVRAAGNRVESNHAMLNDTAFRIEPDAISTVLVKNTAKSNGQAQAGSAHSGGFFNGPYTTDFCPPDQACVAQPAPPWANFDIDRVE